MKCTGGRDYLAEREENWRLEGQGLFRLLKGSCLSPLLHLAASLLVILGGQNETQNSGNTELSGQGMGLSQAKKRWKGSAITRSVIRWP